MDRTEQCSIRVFDDYSSHQCNRRWTVEHDGKRYCKQHDPSVRAAKLALQQAQYRAKISAMAARRERQAALRQALGLEAMADYLVPDGLTISYAEAEVLIARLETVDKIRD